MVDESNVVSLYNLYNHIHKNIVIDENNNHNLMFVNGNMVVDPNDFFYMHMDSDTFNPQNHLSEVLWRISGRDDVSTLSKTSFIQRYAVTEESKTDLFNKINKDFNDINSDLYKEYNEALGLDKLVGRLDPLYMYTRTAPRVKNSNVFYHNLPLADDKLTQLLNMISKDQDFIKLSEEDRNKKISDIIGQNNDMFHDQLNAIFFALQNKISIDNYGFYTLYCVDPLTRPLITESDNYYARNIFNNTNPFPPRLETIQFVIMNDTLNLKMNFNSFDVFDTFDLYYGLVLLLIGSHVLGTNKIGKIYLSSPFYYTSKKYLDKFKSQSLESIPHYKALFKPDSDFKDFSTTQIKHYSFLKL